MNRARDATAALSTRNAAAIGSMTMDVTIAITFSAAIDSVRLREAKGTCSANHGTSQTAATIAAFRTPRGNCAASTPAATAAAAMPAAMVSAQLPRGVDRKSTRLNSSHVAISYAVFCLKKKKRVTEG